MAPSSGVLTALGHPAALEEAYQRLRPQSGREITRVAGALLRSPEELLDDLAPLVEVGAVRVHGTVLEVATPVELVRGVVDDQAVVAARAQGPLEGAGRAIELLAAEQRLSVTGQAGDSRPVEGE